MIEAQEPVAQLHEESVGERLGVQGSDQIQVLALRRSHGGVARAGREDHRKLRATTRSHPRRSERGAAGEQDHCGGDLDGVRTEDRRVMQPPAEGRREDHGHDDPRAGTTRTPDRSPTLCQQQRTRRSPSR